MIKCDRMSITRPHVILQLIPILPNILIWNWIKEPTQEIYKPNLLKWNWKDKKEKGKIFI